MRKIRVLVDMDDIQATFNETLIKTYNERYNTDAKVTDLTTWESMLTITGRCDKQVIMSLIAEKGFYKNLGVVPCAPMYMGHLCSDDRLEVLIVTAVPTFTPYAYKEKLEWIDRWLPFFNKKNFIATHRKDTIRGDVLFDDAMHNVISFCDSNKKATSYLLRKPWNERMLKEDTGRIRIVESWQEFIGKFTKKFNLKWN